MAGRLQVEGPVLLLVPKRFPYRTEHRRGEDGQASPIGGIAYRLEADDLDAGAAGIGGQGLGGLVIR